MLRNTPHSLQLPSRVPAGRTEKEVVVRINFKEMISPSFKDINIDRFFSEYNISPREQSIISLIVKGKTSQEVGKELFISVKTVINHISSVYQKTGMKNRVQLSNLIRSFQE